MKKVPQILATPLIFIYIHTAVFFVYFAILRDVKAPVDDDDDDDDDDADTRMVPPSPSLLTDDDEAAIVGTDDDMTKNVTEVKKELGT